MAGDVVRVGTPAEIAAAVSDIYDSISVWVSAMSLFAQDMRPVDSKASQSFAQVLATANTLQQNIAALVNGIFGYVDDQVSGAGLTRVAIQTANYSAAAGTIVPCDTTAAGFTVTLPNLPDDKSRVLVKLVTQSGTNAVTISTSGAAVFDKASLVTSIVLASLNQLAEMQYDSANDIWTIINDDYSQSTTSLGDTTYGLANGAVRRLAGNATTTQKFYAQTGIGVSSAPPVWFDLYAATINWGAAHTWAAPAVGTTPVTIEAFSNSQTSPLLRFNNADHSEIASFYRGLGFRAASSQPYEVYAGAISGNNPVLSAGVSLRLASSQVVAWADSSTNANSGVNGGIGRAAAGVMEFNNATAGGAGKTFRSIPLSPAQITADLNDYNPGVARIYRLSTDAARTVTGLAISQVNGQEFVVFNVGSNNLVLSHQNASSTAANRFICTGAADITLAADEAALFWYDGTTARFRVRKI